MEYLENNAVGIIYGTLVQCLPVDELDAEFWGESDGGVCGYYDCAFNGSFLGCEIPCCNYEREDNTSVYFKKL